jgi:hypothetical protein
MGLIILIAVGVLVCRWALSRPSKDIGSGDYSGWEFDGDGDD